MRAEKQQGGGVGVADTDSETPQFDQEQGQTTFFGGGPLPPVAADAVGAPSASASERAYGGAPHRADTLLGFDPFGSLGKPRVPTTHVPLTKEADLHALAARKDAEALLTAKGLDASKQASQALEILLNVPDTHRGRVIDGLADKAFAELLDRISPDQRDRFLRLVDVSQKPERKLQLWAEAHKSRANNDIGRLQGDMGPAIATYSEEDEDGAITEEIDEEEEDEIRKTLTRDQLRSRKRHLRRQTAAGSTQSEVDAEVKGLMAKAKKGQLTLKDVDEMRERKELEYQIELQSNVNLTAQTTARDNGTTVEWSKPELERVQRTLARLPHAQDPDGFSELQRTKSKDMFDGTGGMHTGDRIEITDWGASPHSGFRHGGDKREMVSDELKQKQGDTITPLEFVLTHEIGHDVADKDPKAFDAFQKAAGWERVKIDDLRADGVTAADIATLEAQRSNPNTKSSDITGRTKLFSPVRDSKDEFWAVSKGSIPAKDEAAPGPRGEDTWAYSRVNPSEHFAEVYAKAVHVPEKLHDELVVRPTEAAAVASSLYEQMRRQVSALEADKSGRNMAKLANLKALLGALKSDMSRAEAARDQRAQEFAIMRNTVFGTDKAVKLSTERLKAKKVSADRIEEFRERAGRASTPEQVAFLESEASK